MFLLGQIILKKKVMYHRAKHFGYTHSSVVACSQELDVLLNQYQKSNDLNMVPKRKTTVRL